MMSTRKAARSSVLEIPKAVCRRLAWARILKCETLENAKRSGHSIRKRTSSTRKSQLSTYGLSCLGCDATAGACVDAGRARLVAVCCPPLRPPRFRSCVVPGLIDWKNWVHVMIVSWGYALVMLVLDLVFDFGVIRIEDWKRCCPSNQGHMWGFGSQIPPEKSRPSSPRYMILLQIYDITTSVRINAFQF